MATATPTRPPVFNLPNQLTASRFVLALGLFYLIADESWEWCVVVFGVAAATDWLDGYLARKQGLSSTLGRVLDPLVDKVLICGAYIFLLPKGTAEGWLEPWMVTVVVARELVINSLRSFLENRGAEFGADWLGKFKMGLQCAAVFAIFVAQIGRKWSSAPVDFLEFTQTVVIYAMVIITLLSGLQYLWKAALILRKEEEPGERGT
jgi:CDP-diacylglycerol--glycerol-3-phosphate 3-phosphatidyltransferase